MARDEAFRFKITREDMIEEKNETMYLACHYPKVSDLAIGIFQAIDDFASEATNLISGLSVGFQSFDKQVLIKNARMFRNVELERYEPYIDKYKAKLAESYRSKGKDNG